MCQVPSGIFQEWTKSRSLRCPQDIAPSVCHCQDIVPWRWPLRTDSRWMPPRASLPSPPMCTNGEWTWTPMRQQKRWHMISCCHATYAADCLHRRTWTATMPTVPLHEHQSRWAVLDMPRNWTPILPSATAMCTVFENYAKTPCGDKISASSDCSFCSTSLMPREET